MTDNSPLGGETTTPLRLGTRRSKLAMAQSGMVADAVREVTGRAVELVEITTYGDVSREHLAQIGGTGVFVAPVGALADLLADGQVVNELRLRGVVGSTDGTSLVQLSITGPVPTSHDDAAALGRELAAEMLAKGAAGLMGERAL
ncbi:hypothetical protein [Streptomyces sp. gb1(2016)]|uniref:hydroxymethylbilane synthase n=1 Tax=Streptomyces sp. gb1(2016) TaxID=1828321 RepID=A0A652KUW8_9ACTN|nr:hypothetical protein [Streptomyces sp. gb1(2016)]TXS26698.1 hypothetical protein EAO74_11315 [Streptomyces sp. gb1(2016)]